MLDLNKNIVDTENVIMFDRCYLCYHERDDEYAIDYTILDNDLKEVDGGVFGYENNNLTLEELFSFIDKPNEINNYGIEIVNENVKEMIMQSL